MFKWILQQSFTTLLNSRLGQSVVRLLGRSVMRVSSFIFHSLLLWTFINAQNQPNGAGAQQPVGGSVPNQQINSQQNPHGGAVPQQQQQQQQVLQPPVQGQQIDTPQQVPVQQNQQQQFDVHLQPPVQLQQHQQFPNQQQQFPNQPPPAFPDQQQYQQQQQPQQQFNPPPVAQHQQPPPPNAVPPQQMNVNQPPPPPPPQQQQQQQFNAPPPPQQQQQQVFNAPPSPQQQQQQVFNAPQPPVAQQQQFNQPPPVQQAQQPPLPQPPAPPHKHNEQKVPNYDALPPKPRQKKFEAPVVVNNDRELDFYARLPSPKASDGEVVKALGMQRPFITMTVNVSSGVRDCFFYDALSHFEVDMQVLGGDGLDVGLAVIDPSGAPAVIRDPASEASVSINVPDQHREEAYAVCLDNRKASYGRKKVFLAIDLRINWENPSPAEQELINRLREDHAQSSADSEAIREIVANIDRLTATLDRIGGHLQRTLRLNARSRNLASVDRELMLANRDRVTSLSTFQVVALLFVGVLQTLLIRSLFDESSSFYRLWVRGSGRGSVF